MRNSDTDRSPIYQTYSTRVLVPVRRRSRWKLALAIIAALLLIGLAVLLGRGYGNAPAAAPTAPAVAEPSDQRSSLIERLAESTTAAPAAAPATSAPAAAAPTSAPAFRVVGTDGAGLVLRAGPDSRQKALTVLPEGAKLAVIGKDATGAGHTWRHVRDQNGMEGWVAAEYLDKR